MIEKQQFAKLEAIKAFHEKQRLQKAQRDELPTEQLIENILLRRDPVLENEFVWVSEKEFKALVEIASQCHQKYNYEKQQRLSVAILLIGTCRT